MISHPPTYDRMLDVLLKAGRLLPAPKQERQQPPVYEVPPFAIGQEITVLFGAAIRKAVVAATWHDYVVVYAPGTDRRMTKGYPLRDVRLWNPAPELKAVAA
jgi:hypothetical protein